MGSLCDMSFLLRCGSILKSSNLVRIRSAVTPNASLQAKRLYTTEKDAAPSNEEPDASAVLAEKDTKIKQLSDSYLLLLADMENLRGRTKKEVESASQFAITKFSKDIISVADVLEMALKSVDPDHPLITGKQAEVAESDKDAETVPDAVVAAAPGSVQSKFNQLVQGIEMTLAEVRKVLGKHGITPIEPLHQPFDPNLHNALFQVPTADVEPGIVVTVTKRGYVLHHRVLRAADVGVSRQP